MQKLILFMLLASFEDNINIQKIQVLNNKENTIVGIDTLPYYIDTWLYDNTISFERREKILDSLLDYSIRVYGDTSFFSAIVLHKRGVLEHLRGLQIDNKNFYSAIEFYKKALSVRLNLTKIHRTDLHPEIIKGYNMIGICYELLEKPHQSIEYLLKGLEMVDNYPFKDSIYVTVLKLNTQTARTFANLGDFDQALKYYANVINFPISKPFQNKKDEILLWKARALKEVGGIHGTNLYNSELAIKYLTDAERLLNGIKEQEFSPIILSNIYNNLGIAYYRKGNYDSAISYYKTAINLNKDINYKEILPLNYLNLSLSYIKLNQGDSAVKYLKDAENINKKSNKLIDNSKVFDAQGDLAFKRKDFMESLKYDNKAIGNLIPDYEAKSVFSNPNINHKIISDKFMALISLSSKAYTFLYLFEIERENDYLNAAYENYHLADQVISLMRSEFQAEASRLSLAKYAKPIYEQAIETCYQLYQLNQENSVLNKAFEYSEKSRAIVLLDAVRRTNASSKVNPQLIKAEREFNLKANYFEKQAAMLEQDDEKESSYNVYDSLLYYRRQRQKVVDQIKEETPEYYSLIFEQSTINPAELQNTLDEDQTFIEYFLGDSSFYTFVINRETTLFLKNEQVDSVKSWSQQLTQNVLRKDNSFIAPANKLYHHLIQSVKGENVKLTEQLVFVPDDVLGLVNFEMLVTDPPSSDRIYFPKFKNYLIYDHQVSYAFSATALLESDKKNITTDKSFLGIAPLYASGFSYQGTYFDKLESNIKEVNDVSTHYDHLVLTAENASKEAFIESSPNYSILHFATHAKANNENGDLSFITFGPEEKDMLYAKDLYAMNLNAEVVVLSACQTSQGSMNRGEGVISLARGFVYAGASSVITSLWNVKEGTNTSIIKKFYEGLEEGRSKDEALRQSKLAFLNSVGRDAQETAHPYYWATLVCMGDMEPYKRNSAFVWVLVASILILVPCLIFVIKNYYPS